jgi:Carboxypeptidase regulatory-like domain
MKTILSVFLSVLLFLCKVVCAQQPPAPPATSAPSIPSGQTASASPNPSAKSKPVPSFLIIGTVFDERTLSFPGVQVRIRRSGEKKFRWETYTNSRGEFAVRVPPGVAYEVVTHVKDYQDQTESVDSKVDVQQRLSIKLEPRGQEKTGAKP